MSFIELPQQSPGYNGRTRTLGKAPSHQQDIEDDHSSSSPSDEAEAIKVGSPSDEPSNTKAASKSRKQKREDKLAKEREDFKAFLEEKIQTEKKEFENRLEQCQDRA